MLLGTCTATKNALIWRKPKKIKVVKVLWEDFIAWAENREEN